MIRTVLASLVLAELTFAAGTVPRPSPEFVVKMTPSGETLLSKYKGKPTLLVFISTTCPHCQQLTRVLNNMHREYGPKGLQVVSAAFNPMANMLVSDFIRTYKPEYPMGWTTREAVYEYLQQSHMFQLYVPIIVTIDRAGVIREQHLGDDPYGHDPDKNVRASVEVIMKPASTSAVAAGKKK